MLLQDRKGTSSNQAASRPLTPPPASGAAAAATATSPVSRAPRNYPNAPGRRFSAGTTAAETTRRADRPGHDILGGRRKCEARRRRTPGRRRGCDLTRGRGCDATLGSPGSLGLLSIGLRVPSAQVVSVSGSWDREPRPPPAQRGCGSSPSAPPPTHAFSRARI